MTPTNPATHMKATIVFPVADMDEAVAFYRALGFRVTAYDEHYAWVANAGTEIIHLALVAGLDRSANHAAGYLHVRDVDAWHTAWAGIGDAVGPLTDQPWGMREFPLRDPSGNFLRVGQNL